MAGVDQREPAEDGRGSCAKDRRLRVGPFPQMYPRLDEWLESRAELDPEQKLRSDLGRSLGLC